ncbi:globin-coupled sensor protein [Phenylobacterium sp.]|uniref:globin-coupled sensor protein n=1 Tax=Phenylobacterium sp. TaxID=1871053 RepID=UPI0035B0C577
MADNYAIEERLSFIGIDEDTRKRLRALQPVIAANIGPSLDGFYEQVRKTPKVRAFFKDEAQIGGAARAQQGHWANIASGQYDQSYVTAVRAIGETHARIGLEPRWYIAGYAMICEALLSAVVAEHWPKGLLGKRDGAEAAGAACGALMKAAMLDMDFAISIYLDTLAAERARLQTEREANEARQNAVVKALADALARVAEGDLRARLTLEVDEGFQPVKDDFNRAMGALEAALAAVSSSSEVVGSGADQIGVASDELSRRTEQQAATLEQTAAALEQITATVTKSAAGARQASEVVSTAKAQAERSGEVMTEAVTAMSQIEESSRQITQIIGVIDEIAFQTNLLALNAGVEAARAGDAGKGFAVVASEVRALAQRSADAAKEIKALISASTDQVAEGVTLVGQTGQALTTIVAQVGEINGLVEEMAHSSQEQSTALHEVNQAVAQMDQLTQKNAAMVQETSAATQALKSQTHELGRLVATFTVDPSAAGAGRASEGATGRRAA